MSFIYIFLGGGLGSICRYLLSKAFISHHSFYTYGTILSNVLATLILGLFVFIFRDKLQNALPLHLFLAIGFCGGFSTFSTFSLETFKLLEKGMIGWAIANVLVSVLVCLTLLFFIYKIAYKS